MRRLRSTLGVATLGLVAFLAPATSAYALWSASATGTMTVSTAANFTLSCGAKKGNSAYTVGWSSFSGATSYQVYEAATNDDVQFQISGTTSGVMFDVQMPVDGPKYVRVRAMNGNTPASPLSNTLLVTRSPGPGNSSTFTCDSVSP